MKRNSLVTALFLCTALMPCSADTFTLKDGTVLEGSIISETGDSYVIEVQVTKSIKDERTIAKEDIAKIEREKLDLTAFAEVEKLLPVPDFQTSSDYAERVATVNKFIKDHSASPKVKQAKEILAKLETEAKEVSAGGIKFSGKIMSPAGYQANAYDLDARVMEAKIRSLVDAGQLLPALRTYLEFDRDYRSTLANGSLAPLMIQVIRSYLAQTNQLLLSFDSRVKERELGLERMAAADRQITAKAIEEENAAVDAAYQTEKAAKGWLTTHPYHKASLADTVKFAEQELARLTKMETALGVDGGKSFREAYSAVHSGADAATVNAALTAAKTAGVPARYLQPLEMKAKAVK